MLDTVSDKLLHLKMSSASLWDITNHHAFKAVYDHAMRDIFLHLTARRTLSAFAQTGPLYFHFLKSLALPKIKPAAARQPTASVKPHGSTLDSVIHLLENEQQGFTIDQICEKLAVEDLSHFSGQEFKSIVQVKIDRVCENSGCSVCAADNRFKKVKNQRGDNVYHLLSRLPDKKNDAAAPEDSAGLSEAKGSPIEATRFEIWNTVIANEFNAWLQVKNYKTSTADFYVSSMNRIFMNFNALGKAALSGSSTTMDAVYKFAALLHRDGAFQAMNRNTLGQTSDILNAFIRFVGKDLVLPAPSAPMVQSRFTAGKTSSMRLVENWKLPKESPEHSIIIPTEVETIPSKTFQAADNANQRNPASNEPTSDTIIQSKDTSTVSIVHNLLSAKFSNGIRIDSIIELSRFRRYCSEELGMEVTDDNEELKQLISDCGTYFNGKTYAVSMETKLTIKKEVDSAFKNGMRVIFYDAFYEKHEDWLYPQYVISSDMLRSLLMALYPKYTHKIGYVANGSVSSTEIQNIRGEILRVWGDDEILSYEQMAGRLPYIPLGKMKITLASSEDYIWHSEEIYTHISKFDINDSERDGIIDYCANRCRKNGYASINDVPLGEIAERYGHLTPVAVQSAVFRLCLAGRFEKKGKIITLKGDTLDVLTILKAYCREADACTLEELSGYEKELSGENRVGYILEAAYSKMIRADKDNFLSDSHLSFDATIVDEAIALHMTGEYLPLKSFTTFAAFPHCGRAWNLYLLESYCRRFSKRFRFEELSVNSRNAGAVIRRDCQLSYDGIMADALAKSGIDLKQNAVEEYLFVSGFLGRRAYSKVHELMKQAKTIRETRN